MRMCANLRNPCVCRKCPFGGNIKTEAKTSSVPHEEENNAEAEMDVESDESEIELDMEGT